jgi:hypothetical protein
MRPPNKADKAFLDKVRKLRGEGMTWSEVAAKSGYNCANLQQRFERLEYREIKTAKVACDGRSGEGPGL